MRRAAPALACALALALAACGGGGDEPPPAPAAAEPPYPPTAAEPGRAPAPGRRPAGRVVRIGGPAEGLALDPETGVLAAALQREPAGLALVDARSLRVRETVPLPAAPRHLELAEPGGPVLVPDEEADALVQVALPGGETTSTRVGDHPHDAAFLDGRAFTIDEFSSTLTEVQDGRRRRQATVDAQPGGVVALGDQLAVISVLGYTIELFDPETLRGGGSRSAGMGPTHIAADGDARGYITDTRGGALIVYATRPRLKWVGRIPLDGGPYGIAVDDARDKVWVALSGRNELVELTTGDQPVRRRTFPTVRQPNSVAVDPRDGRVFVASARDDALQVLEP